LPCILQTVSGAIGKSVEEIAYATTETACQFFNLQ